MLAFLARRSISFRGRSTSAPWSARRGAGDLLFGGTILALTAMTARVWWLTDIVPGQDYPQFLVFVRAVQDYRDPASPFHGTYTTGPWFMPTGLPVHLTSLLSCLFFPRSIESAGKLLLSLQSVGLIGAYVLLLKGLGRPRWSLALFFPLAHSQWTVVGGFAAFATALPLVVLGWALTVLWLRRLDFKSGIALAACMSTTLFWHGIAYAQLGLSFAVLWAIWREPSWRARLRAVLPTVPSLVQYALWMRTTFGHPRGDSHWLPPWSSVDAILHFIWTSTPHRSGLALLFSMLIGTSLALNRTNLGARGVPARMWRVDNPLLWVSLAYLAAFFLLPLDMDGVEGLSNRFPYLAALAFVPAWNLPSGGAARGVVLAAVVAFSVWCLDDVAGMFRAFDEETRGASELMNVLGPHDTLYYWSGPEGGPSTAFFSPNKAMRELQQLRPCGTAVCRIRRSPATDTPTCVTSTATPCPGSRGRRAGARGWPASTT